MSLREWLKQAGNDLRPTDRFEYDFQNEGSRVGQVPLSGKVDRLIIDEKKRTINVLDYKTGKAYSRWQGGVIKLHLFSHQLLIYKLLIESSARFRGYRVEKGIIEFVEPDAEGQIQRLELIFEQTPVDHISSLIKAVWESIQSLKFPDISGYPKTIAGIRQFEADLISPEINKNTS